MASSVRQMVDRRWCCPARAEEALLPLLVSLLTPMLSRELVDLVHLRRSGRSHHKAWMKVGPHLPISSAQSGRGWRSGL